MCRFLFVRCDNEPAPWSAEGAWGRAGVGPRRGHWRGQWRPCRQPLPLVALHIHPLQRSTLRAVPHALSDLHLVLLLLLPLPLTLSALPLADFGDRPGLETNIPEAAAEEVKKVDKGQVFSMNDKPWWDWNADKEVRTAAGGGEEREKCSAAAAGGGGSWHGWRQLRGRGGRSSSRCGRGMRWRRLQAGTCAVGCAVSQAYLLTCCLSPSLSAPWAQEWGWSRDPPVSLKTGGGVTGKQAARKKVRGGGRTVQDVCLHATGHLRVWVCTGPRHTVHPSSHLPLISHHFCWLPFYSCSAVCAGQRAGEGPQGVCLRPVQERHAGAHLDAMR